MCYLKAKDVLPIELIELLQQYVEGEYLYIPQKEHHKLEWGSQTKTREELRSRNLMIYTEFQEGVSKMSLADKYYLSVKSIERIILEQKRMLLKS